MALHTELKIYKTAYDLLDHVTNLATNMPRAFKQLIGNKLSSECADIVLLIFRANVAANKTPHLQTLIERLQVMELLLRLSKDKRLISVGQYATAIEMTGSVGKQATGWRKHAMSSAS